jgi:hypothetical protein
MKTLSELINEPSREQKEAASFVLFSWLMAHEPQSNPWHTADRAFECTEAFFEVAAQRRKDVK